MELELQEAISHLTWVLETKLWLSRKARGSLNLESISAPLNFIFIGLSNLMAINLVKNKYPPHIGRKDKVAYDDQKVNVVCLHAVVFQQQGNLESIDKKYFQFLKVNFKMPETH